jgi:hypothetical protein
MLEPTTLPTAMSVWRRTAATTEVASSGSEVPAATSVRPMTQLGDPERPRDAGGAVHQPRRPPHQQGEARENEGDVAAQPPARRRQPQAVADPFLELGAGSRGWRAQ